MDIAPTIRPSALVMAGTRGLGLASATELAKLGWPVAVCGRTPTSVDAAVDELSQYGPALGVIADVSRADDVNVAVERVSSQLGPIGVLVANAGGPGSGSFDDTDEQAWNSAYQTTLMSVVRSVRAVLPGMRARGEGRLIIVGSSSIKRPISNLVLSNVFRPAVEGLVKDLAVRLAPERITVNMVAPGRIETDRVIELDIQAGIRTGVAVEDIRRHSEAGIPMGRYGRPEEFAAVVGFLASSKATYITGQSILVDGGMVTTRT